jgi:two-component system C4-dicarboxylate transport response regulator DctD
MNNPQNLLPADPDHVVVLVAEDEVMIQNVARIALEKAGFFVLTATDGEEALTISRGFPSTIHALVSDIKMPKLDGFGLRERIVAERPAIKVLLMSGQVDPHVGGVTFLRKPFRPAQLREKVEAMFSD